MDKQFNNLSGYIKIKIKKYLHTFIVKSDFDLTLNNHPIKDGTYLSIPPVTIECIYEAYLSDLKLYEYGVPYSVIEKDYRGEPFALCPNGNQNCRYKHVQLKYKYIIDKNKLDVDIDTNLLYGREPTYNDHVLSSNSYELTHVFAIDKINNGVYSIDI